MRSINTYFVAYAFIFATTFLIVSLDNYDFTSTSTAIIATINNIGPGLDAVGPYGNYGGFSDLSKLVLIFNVL